MTTYNTGDSSAVTTIAAPNPVDSDEFGGAIYMCGDYAYIASRDTSFTGRVYVYKQVNRVWQKQTNIFNHSSTDYDYIWNPLNTTNDGERFGASGGISSNGSRIAVTARFADENGLNSGKLFIYHLNGSKYEAQTISQPSFSTAGDDIGVSCTMNDDGTVIVVSASKDDTFGSDAGNFTVYKYNQSTSLWARQDYSNLDTILGISGSSQLGMSVALNPTGNLFAIAINDNKVFLWEDTTQSDTSTFSYAATITSSNTNFATQNKNLKLYGNYILAASTYRNVPIEYRKTYLYEYEGSGTVSLKATIDSPDTEVYFGRALAMDWRTIVISDRGYDSVGRAYVFTFDPTDNSVTLNYRLEGTGVANVDKFGEDIAIEGDYIMVGHVGVDNGAVHTNSGAVEVFDLTKMGEDLATSASSVTTIEPPNKLEAIPPAVSPQPTRFGQAVSSQGDYMVVSSKYHPDNGTDGSEGVVYLYKFVNGSWTKQTGVYGGNDYFHESNSVNYGVAVDVSSDGFTVIVGDQLYSSNTGAFYIYNGNGSYTKATIASPGFLSSGDRYGLSCALSSDGTVAIVTAFRDDESTVAPVEAGDGALAVYKYNGSTWPTTTQSGNAPLQEILPSNANNYRFGRACAINDRGDILVVNEESGDTIHVYYDSNSSSSTSNFSLVNTITTFPPSDTVGGSSFNLSAYGDYFLIGAIGGNKAYLYQVTSNYSTLTQKLAINSPDSNQANFGNAVSLRNNRIIIGDSGANTQGSAYVYYYETSSNLVAFRYRLLQNTAGNDDFGYDVSINGDHVFVGNRNYDITDYPDAGALFIYNLAICFAEGSLVLCKDGYKAVEDLQRGDLVYCVDVKDYVPLARLCKGNGQTGSFVRFDVSSVGENSPQWPTIITRGHPVYYENDFYNPEDFAHHEGYPGVMFIESTKPLIMYTLQFEEHHIIDVNGMHITSLPPYTTFNNQYLSPNLYFDKSKFNADNVGKCYPPYMLHCDPIPNYKLA